MSHRREKRARRAARAALMTAVSLDVLAIAMPASAQEATQSATTASADDVLQEVVVTGFRASLGSAIERKRASVQPIESIVAEDIGKMPDQNVAESLQRLPGIQINRAGGKGTQVLIDGLSNNLITLNGEVFLTGKEFYVSGEASGGGNGSNIQYSSLEGIPSEEIGGIDVIKNPSAADREGGLGRHHKSDNALGARAAPWAESGSQCPRYQSGGRAGRRHSRGHAGGRIQVQRHLRAHGEPFV